MRSQTSEDAVRNLRQTCPLNRNFRPMANQCCTRLPFAHWLAPELLITCGKYGVSAASVFPGYDGSARAQIESLQAHNYIAEG
jgi:hypothetical protein